ncbi:hypothetical protein EDB80DRAFT_673814 [Ilyonectria destructans]|nr:hypothetical protein EDB80DRAFT_673814 [Ilyonectria destructans]
MDFALRVLQIPMSELTAASDMPCDKATIRVAIAVCEVLADVKPGFRHVKQHFEAYENTTGRAQAELAYTLFCCELGDPSFRSSIRPAAILNAFDVSRILSEVPSPGAEDPSPGEASEAIRVMEEMVGRFGMIEDVRVWKRDLVREFGVAVGLLQDGKVALQDTQARLKRFHQSSTDVDDGVQNIQQGCENLISIQGQLKSTLDSL